MKHKGYKTGHQGAPNRNTGYWEFTKQEWVTFDIVLDNVSSYAMEMYQRPTVTDRTITWGEFLSKPISRLGKGYEGYTINPYEVLGALIAKRLETYCDDRGSHRKDISAKQWINFRHVIKLMETQADMQFGLELLDEFVEDEVDYTVTATIKKKLVKQKATEERAKDHQLFTKKMDVV